MTLIALGGLKESGKDTAADHLVEVHGFVKFGMSDALNDAMLTLNPWIMLDYPERIGYLRTTTWEPVKYRDLHDAVGYVAAKRHSEVREFLQVLGTEVGRDMIDPDVWVSIMRDRIEEKLKAGVPVALTAARFPNELAMVRELGGLAVWVERDAVRPSEAVAGPRVYTGTQSVTKSLSEAHRAVEQHASETSVGPSDFDIVIENNGTLEELYEETDELPNIAGRGTAFLKATLGEHMVNWPAYDH